MVVTKRKEQVETKILQSTGNLLTVPPLFTRKMNMGGVFSPVHICFPKVQVYALHGIPSPRLKARDEKGDANAKHAKR